MIIESISAQRILVVDPEPSRRELLRYVLVADGHEVDEAQDRSQAYDKLHQTKFDVILADSAELEVCNVGSFPQIQEHGAITPVLTISDQPVADPTEELRRFTVNPFDLVSIRQALAAVHELVAACANAISASSGNLSTL